MGFYTFSLTAAVSADRNCASKTAWPQDVWGRQKSWKKITKKSKI